MTIETEHTLDRLLVGLARPRRRELVRCLVEQPRSIADLSTILDLGDSAVYENLRVLRQCNLVRSSREEGWTRYYLVRDGLTPLLDWLRTTDSTTTRRSATAIRTRREST
ncbi:ArsR/SmtB family transcription factor [Gordonia aquimaris]|uniref:ArsR/SmtB family transcription factor n=1 Tax=Gordonia aquimaris TaxID=2984863 RepID=UPI003557685B